MAHIVDTNVAKLDGPLPASAEPRADFGSSRFERAMGGSAGLPESPVDDSAPGASSGKPRQAAKTEVPHAYLMRLLDREGNARRDFGWIQVYKKAPKDENDFGAIKLSIPAGDGVTDESVDAYVKAVQALLRAKAVPDAECSLSVTENTQDVIFQLPAEQWPTAEALFEDRFGSALPWPSAPFGNQPANNAAPPVAADPAAGAQGQAGAPAPAPSPQEKQPQAARRPEITDPGMFELAEKASLHAGALFYNRMDEDRHRITFRVYTNASISNDDSQPILSKVRDDLVPLFRAMEADSASSVGTSYPAHDAEGANMIDIEYEFPAGQFIQARKIRYLLEAVHDHRCKQFELAQEKLRQQQEAQAKQARQPEPQSEDDHYQEQRPNGRGPFETIIGGRNPIKGQNHGGAYVTDAGFDHSGIDFSAKARRNEYGHYLDESVLYQVYKPDNFGSYAFNHRRDITHFAISETHGRPTIKTRQGDVLQLVHPKGPDGKRGALSHIVYGSDECRSGALLLDQLEAGGHSIDRDKIVISGTKKFQHNANKAIDEEIRQRNLDLLLDLKDLKKATSDLDDLKLLKNLMQKVSDGDVPNSVVTKILREHLSDVPQALNTIGNEAPVVSTHAQIANLAALANVTMEEAAQKPSRSWKPSFLRPAA